MRDVELGMGVVEENTTMTKVSYSESGGVRPHTPRSASAMVTCVWWNVPVLGSPSNVRI